MKILDLSWRYSILIYSMAAACGTTIQVYSAPGPFQNASSVTDNGKSGHGLLSDH